VKLLPEGTLTLGNGAFSRLPQRARAGFYWPRGHPSTNYG